jgi:hypothetical protein
VSFQRVDGAIPIEEKIETDVEDRRDVAWGRGIARGRCARARLRAALGERVAGRARVRVVAGEPDVVKQAFAN